MQGGIRRSGDGGRNLKVYWSQVTWLNSEGDGNRREVVCFIGFVQIVVIVQSKQQVVPPGVCDRQLQRVGVPDCVARVQRALILYPGERGPPPHGSIGRKADLIGPNAKGSSRPSIGLAPNKSKIWIWRCCDRGGNFLQVDRDVRSLNGYGDGRDQ